MGKYNRKTLKSEAPVFPHEHLHSFGEIRQSTSSYAEALVGIPFAFISASRGAFSEGGEDG
jgi:hypothetical protein